MKKSSASNATVHGCPPEFSQLVKQIGQRAKCAFEASVTHGIAKTVSNLPSPYLYPGLSAKDRKQTPTLVMIKDMIECGLSIYPSGRLRGRHKLKAETRAIITSLVMEAYGREISYNDLANTWAEVMPERRKFTHGTLVTMRKNFLVRISQKFRGSYEDYWKVYTNIRNKMLLEGFIDFELINKLEAGETSFKKPYPKGNQYKKRMQSQAKQTKKP